MSNTMKAERYHTLAWAIILASTLVRLWFVGTGQLDLVQDEAQYWDWSRTMQLSYYSKGPLIAWVNALGVQLLGNTEFGVRIGAVFFSLASQVVLWIGLARLMGRPRLGFWTLVVLNTTPLFMASAVLMTTDSPLLFCWLGGMFSLYWAGRCERPLAPLALFAGCMAVGILAKYMMLAAAPMALAYALVLRRQGLAPAGFTRGVCLAVLVGVLLGMAPIVGWNMQHDWVGFRHVGALAGVAGSKSAPLLRFDRFPEFFGSQVGLLTPWWFCYALFGGVLALRVPRGRVVVGEEETDGLGARELWLLVIFFWPMWLFFMLWSFHAKIYPNWPAMCYVAGIMLGGWALARHLRSARSRWVRLWPALGVLTFVLLSAQNWIPLPAHLNPTQRLKGWSDLGTELGRLQQEEFANPEHVFYFASSYDITAALAFYAPGQPRTYCAFWGRRMSQYDLWPGPEDKAGWDAIYVTKDFRDRLPPELEEVCASVETRHYQTTHRGRPARKFTMALCRDFTGDWPRAGQERF